MASPWNAGPIVRLVSPHRPGGARALKTIEKCRFWQRKDIIIFWKFYLNIRREKASGGAAWRASLERTWKMQTLLRQLLTWKHIYNFPSKILRNSNTVHTDLRYHRQFPGTLRDREEKQWLPRRRDASTRSCIAICERWEIISMISSWEEKSQYIGFLLLLQTLMWKTSKTSKNINLILKIKNRKKRTNRDR